MIAELKTVEDYDDFTARSNLAIVHFGFKWNSFDRTMMRSLIELAVEFPPEKVNFGFLDIDQNATIPVLQRVKLVKSPTLVYFRNGEHQGTSAGMLPMDEVRARIKSLLGDESNFE